jgi:RNA polymerase sigma-70 factor (ECF subfamily)
MTDAELVARAVAGEDGAFVTLVERYHASCLRYARHRLGRDSEAEEIVQDTFLRAHQALGRYRERESFRAWVFQILVNRCRTAARRLAGRNGRFVRDEAALGRAVAPAADGLSQVRRRLDHALLGLDAAHREAFLLKVGEEMEYEEIARLTGASVSALKMRVKRARDHVRARWGEFAC